MKRERIRVLLADDHVVVRRGLAALLRTEPDLEVVGEAGDGRQAVSLARELEPDVVLMDLVMPVMDGIEAIREITALRLPTQVLVLTSFGSDNKLFPAIRAGAVGYLLKDASPEQLVRAIRAAADGLSSLDSAVARRLLREFHPDDPAAAVVEPLTERELEVLRQVARGLGNERIGARLDISVATVRTHVSNILAKLGLSNRTQAALYALRTGVASLDEIEEDPGE